MQVLPIIWKRTHTAQRAVEISRETNSAGRPCVLVRGADYRMRIWANGSNCGARQARVYTPGGLASAIINRNARREMFI